MRESYLARHADKGEWQINEAELKEKLPPDLATLARAVLKERYLDQNKDIIPLRLEGVQRAMRLGESVYENLPGKSILVSLDSGKERAELTLELATARIHQLENEKHKDDTGRKRVDTVKIEEAEFFKLMEDENTQTWEAFGNMMKTEGLTERAAIARQANAIDRPGAGTPGPEDAKAAADRYRRVIRELRERVTSERVPVVILGVGHSGPLSFIRHQEKGADITEEEVPQFAEIFVFDEDAKLVETRQVEI